MIEKSLNYQYNATDMPDFQEPLTLPLGLIACRNSQAPFAQTFLT